MNIECRKVSELIPYINNPRNNDDAVDYVAASISEFGFKVPIIIDKDGVVVTGHTRLKAAKKLGLEEVPVTIADDLTPAQIKAFRLADNKVSEQSGWDYMKLELEIEDIDLDMSKFGFEESDLTDYEDFFVERDEKEKQSKKVICPHCGKEFDL